MTPFAPERWLNVVGEERLPAAGGAWVESRDPYRADVWAEAPRCGPGGVDRVMTCA